MKAKTPQEIRRRATRTLIWVMAIFLMTFVALGGILNIAPLHALEAISAAWFILLWLAIRVIHLGTRYWKANELERLYNRDVNFIQNFARTVVQHHNGEYGELPFSDEFGIFGHAPMLIGSNGEVSR